MQQTKTERPATGQPPATTSSERPEPHAPTAWERLDALEASLAVPKKPAAPSWKWNLAALIRAARFWKR